MASKWWIPVISTPRTCANSSSMEHLAADHRGAHLSHARATSWSPIAGALSSVFVEDTSPGRSRHSYLLACDTYRYGLARLQGLIMITALDNLYAWLCRRSVLTPRTTPPSPLNLVDEHPGGRGRSRQWGEPCLEGRRLRDFARRVGLHRRHVRLPAGHSSHQWTGAEADRGPLPDTGLRSFPRLLKR